MSIRPDRIVFAPIAVAVAAACSSSATSDTADERTAQRDDAVWARDENGTPVPANDRDEGDRNVVVRIPTKNLPPGANDTACSGILLTPSLLLTSTYCLSDAKGTASPIVQVGATEATLVTRELAGSAFPNVRMVPVPNLVPNLDATELVVVRLALPKKGEAYLAASMRPSLDAPPLSARSPQPSGGGNRSIGTIEMVGWSPFAIGEDGTTVMQAATHGRRQSVTVTGATIYGLTADGIGPFFVREVFDPMRPSTARAGLHDGDVGGAIFYTANGARRLIGMATTVGMTGTPAEDGTELPAERPTPDAIRGTHCDETRCDAWIDLTNPTVKAFLQQTALNGAPAGKGRKWKLHHPRKDGMTAYWYGESDSTGGACDKTRDADCDGWLDNNDDTAGNFYFRERDNCVPGRPGQTEQNSYNPDQADDDDDGIGNACDPVRDYGPDDIALTGGAQWSSVPVAAANGDGSWSISNAWVGDFGTWSNSTGTDKVTGDFDRDGRTDILLTGRSDWGSLPVAFANGGGNWRVTNASVPNFPTWSSGANVSHLAGDFDGDGRTDVALTGVNGWWTIPVAFSNGDGTFRVKNEGASDFAKWSFGAKKFVGDFDGDGKSDIALDAIYPSGKVPIAFSNGDGTFRFTNADAPGFGNVTTNASSQQVTGDFNGDGRTDLAITSLFSEAIVLALSNGDGNWTVFRDLTWEFQRWAFQPRVTAMAGDFDKDGLTDIALVGGQTWTSIPIAFAKGNGTWRFTNQYVGDFGRWAEDPNVTKVAGDFNQDGRTDIALTGVPGWGSVPVAFAKGDGGWTITNASVGDFAAWSATRNVTKLVGSIR
jgi:hypothetical protein